MCFPALIAVLMLSGRSVVACASKYISSSGFARQSLRSVLQRSIPCACASARSLFSFRPTRIGLGMSTSPSGSETPPCSRIAAIERMRCWLVPMRPVTPFMMIPTVRTVIRVPFRVVHTGVTVRRYYRLYVASYMLCSEAGVDQIVHPCTGLLLSLALRRILHSGLPEYRNRSLFKVDWQGHQCANHAH